MKVLLVHGLNNNTAVMRDLEKIFLDQNYTTQMVSLSGHNNSDLHSMNKITHDHWVEDLANAITKNDDQNFILVGFSLGCLVIESYLKKYGANRVKQVFYFAPAFQIKTLPKALIHILDFIGIKKIKSIPPKKYCANPYLALNMYKQLFTLSHQVKLDRETMPNLPRLFFINPKDELIDYQKTIQFVLNVPQAQWVKLQKSPKASIKIQHLCVLENGHTEANWQRYVHAIKNRLRSWP